MIKRFLPFCVIALLAVSCASLGLESEEPKGPPVHKGISSDAYIYVRATHNHERGFLDPCWDRVLKAFNESGIVEEVKGIVSEMMGASDTQALESMIGPYMDLLKAVDWGAFIEDEFVFGVHAGFPQHTHTVLVRMSVEKAAANMKALADLFDAVAELDESITTVHWNHDKAAIVTLDFGNKWMPIAPTIACDGEVFVASTVKENVVTALELVSGAETTAVPIVETKAFKEAFDMLPEADDSVFYMEPDKIFTAYDNLSEWNGRTREELGINLGEKRFTLDEMMHLVHPHILMAERIATVETTRDRRTYMETVEILAPDWEQRPVAALFKNQPLIKDYARYVPANALSFSLSAGFDPAALHDMLLELFKKVAPQNISDGFLMQWKGIQDHIGFYLREDLLACIEGGAVSVSFPAERPTQFSSTESVTLLKLRNKEKMRSTFNHWTGMLGKLLDGITQQAVSEPGASPVAQILARFRIKLSPVEIEGFEDGKKLTIAIMPFLQPVFGFHGDHFVFASSENGLKTYLDFLVGGKPNILENEAYADLDLEVPDNLCKIGFEDVGASYQELAQFLSMTSMFTMMMPENEPEVALVKKIIGLLPKLGPVVAAMDFMGYQAYSKAYESGMTVVRTRKVTTYRVEEQPKEE